MERIKCIMKTLIKIEYGLRDFTIKELHKKFYIKTADSIYIFEETRYDEQLIQSINDRGQFYRVIMNNRKKYITNVNEKKYILYKINSQINNDSYTIMQVNRRNLRWGLLWSNKLDQIEEQLTNMPEKIKETINYYIGLAQNSILYWNSIKEKEGKLIIGKRRMDNKVRFDPNNAIIDYPERNVAEYIKSSFFEENIKLEEIKKLLSMCQNKNYNMELIFSRLLFPTYYFDEVEDFLENGAINEKRVEKVEKLQKKYEEILEYIQETFISKGEKIYWIKKT